jgi:hypothetical protein
LIETVGDKEKGQISGEDDYFEYIVDVPFQKGDRLGAFVKNVTTAIDNNVYPVKLWISYFYEGV